MRLLWRRPKSVASITAFHLRANVASNSSELLRIPVWGRMDVRPLDYLNSLFSGFSCTDEHLHDLPSFLIVAWTARRIGDSCTRCRGKGRDFWRVVAATWPAAGACAAWSRKIRRRDRYLQGDPRSAETNRTPL